MRNQTICLYNIELDLIFNFWNLFLKDGYRYFIHLQDKSSIIIGLIHRKTSIKFILHKKEEMFRDQMWACIVLNNFELHHELYLIELHCVCKLKSLSNN